MKYIFLNLKRFDVSPKNGGVNHLSPINKWGSYIVESTQNILAKYKDEADFVMYMPEAHVITACNSLSGDVLKIGCQSVYKEDTLKGKNFGALTSNRSANAMIEIGCTSTIIGHCEERNDKLDFLSSAGVESETAKNTVNKTLNMEIKSAQRAGLNVLYCVGEKEEELPMWDNVLKEQLRIGLHDVDLSKITIAYEPIWSIGPGKTAASKEYIEKIVKFIKNQIEGVDVVYGGGLKKENAAMLASIKELDGGLIALTRFDGDIGFYPDEYLEIVKTYLHKEKS